MEWEGGPPSSSAGERDSALFSDHDVVVVPSPYLEILTEPQPKFRFRYKSEMTGKHGSLCGVSAPSQDVPVSASASPSQNGNKLFPSVKVKFA